MPKVSDHPYRWLDVFTDQPLSGNPLAVFTAGERLDPDLLQPIAREMNLAEVVFLFPPREGGDARLRIFSTVDELPFAGHPVLGTACLLALERGQLGRCDLRLETGRGAVSVSVDVGADGRLSGWMEQPLPSVRRWEGDVGALLGLLGVERSVLPVELYDNGIPHLYVMAGSEVEVARVRPDFAAMGRISKGARVNLFAGSEGRYVTRMFAPDDYVPEDPATGSAAGPLAAHLVRHERIRSAQEIQIFQGAQVGRPSTLWASAEGSVEQLSRVRVGGSAVFLGGGSLRLP